jgi:hypothetical protein
MPGSATVLMSRRSTAELMIDCRAVATQLEAASGQGESQAA